MKILRSEAIILHTLPARERDKLIVFLTADRGKLKGWAYGARSAKTRFGASLEPLAKVRIGYLEREAEEVVRIESVDLVRSLFPAQQRLEASVAATYLAETIDTFAQPHDPSELLYRLLDRCCEALLGDAPVTAVVAYAEMWVLKLAGILPSIRNCFECHAALERPLRFEPAALAFVCPSCATRGAAIVSNDVAGAMEAILRLPVETFASQAVARDILFEIRSLAGSMRRNFLGHELKSFDILAGVVRG